MANHLFQSPTCADAAPAPELDLRDLPAPEPMQRALAAANALQPSRSVTVLTPLVPTPLLELLHAQGLQTTVTMLPDGGACVVIERRASSEQSTPDPRHDG